MESNIAEQVKIAPDAEIIVSDSLTIGPYARIGKGFKAKCRSLHIGRHCWIGENVTIGSGGCTGPHAHVFIDDFAGLMNGVLINCAEPVRIGKYCGLGIETQIWTHSAWLPVVMGFPKQKQEPVTIGERVWLPSRCQVLPGVTIGDNVVVGIGSLVNHNLPSGCFAAGRPCEVKENHVYPRELSDRELDKILTDLVNNYMEIAEDKGFKPTLVVSGQQSIIFAYEQERAFFHCQRAEFYGSEYLSPYAEDFRDYLRRNGFAFYGGGFFESLTPTRFK